MGLSDKVRRTHQVSKRSPMGSEQSHSRAVSYSSAVVKFMRCLTFPTIGRVAPLDVLGLRHERICGQIVQADNSRLRSYDALALQQRMRRTVPLEHILNTHELRDDPEQASGPQDASYTRDDSQFSRFEAMILEWT